MQRRVAVMVDAGYLFAQGSANLFGHKQPRSATRLNVTAMIEQLTDFAESISGADLLRIYWYDGTSSGPSAQHLAIANANNTKVRLGIVNRRQSHTTSTP